MEFTTRLELQSQTARLAEFSPYRRHYQDTYGIVTLYDTLFQRISTWVAPETGSIDYNSKSEASRFRLELFPLHSPLLGESLLVSFPPLINMLKFSG
jgi:hypothetical protein